jgi:hypothetical protein
MLRVFAAIVALVGVMAIHAQMFGGRPSTSTGGGTATATCERTIGDPGAASPALASDNASLFQCLNGSGASLTITAVKCRANAGAATSIRPVITGGAITTILSAALVCPVGSWGTGTLNGTPAQANAASIDVNFAAVDGITKQISVVIVRQ